MICFMDGSHNLPALFAIEAQFLLKRKLFGICICMFFGETLSHIALAK